MKKVLATCLLLLVQEKPFHACKSCIPNYFTGLIMIIRHCFNSSVVTTYPFAQKAQFQLPQNVLYSPIIVSEIFSEFVAKLRITNLKMEIEGPEKMNKITIPPEKLVETSVASLLVKLPRNSTQKIPKLLYSIPPDYIISFSLKTGALGILLKNVASIAL